jgi:ubiquinone/menaquinone biosynthesis C-methylase UbiE
MGAFETFLVNRIKRRANVRLFHVLQPLLPHDSTLDCLELGCGTGDMANRLAGHLRPRRYVATDYDPAQIERAGHRLGGAARGIEWRTADALELPFPDGSFDLVFAFAVLHHVEDHFWHYEKIPRALGEIERVLKPSARFVYQEYVHKSRIRGHLAARGFRIGRHPGRLGIGEVVLATRDST